MKQKQSSITSLLMLGVLSATLIYSFVFFMLIYTQVGNTLDLLRNRSLDEQAHQIGDYLARIQVKTGAPKHEADAEFYNNTSNYQYVVRDAATGKVILHSPLVYIDGFPATTPGEKNQSFYFYDPQGNRFLGTSITQKYGDQDFIIQIAQSEESIKSFSDILTHTFLQRISLLGIPFLFVLMLVIALSIKLIMSPLTKALKQAQEISFANPEIRLNDTAFPQEIRPLALAMNGALDRLENGIKAQKDFIANAAHELRTPLSILRAHVDLLEDKTVASRMRSDVDSMARLVSQLLDTARLESPEPLEMHPVDLAEVVRAVSQAIWPLMVKDDREFDVDGIEEPVVIHGNFDAIYRALRNLLENALKYSPRGTKISLHLDGTSIAVRDCGEGISDTDRENLFKKFSRKDMQQGNGAGLGLFIVYKIMQLHGGRVAVENVPEGGALFTLKFPDNNT
jgi:signal transduction histidine kinase